MPMALPLTVIGKDSARFGQSGRLLSAVIMSQSARFHTMFNSLATWHITQIPYLPSLRMGTACPCGFPRKVEDALAYRTSAYQALIFRSEKADTRAIQIFFVAAGVLAVTHLYLGTDTVLSFGRS